MNSSRFLVFSLFFFSFSKIILGQDTLHLQNPSFEGLPGIGNEISHPMKEWQACELNTEVMKTPTAESGTIKAFDGTTYLRLEAHKDGTWEGVSQVLKTELIAEVCYSFHVYLRKCPTYENEMQDSNQVSSPIMLLIWGGDKECDEAEALDHTGPITNTEWQEYSFEFWPEWDYEYITLEAFYLLPFTEAYDGCILVDGLSPIIEISCY